MLISSLSSLSGIWTEEVTGSHTTSQGLTVAWVPGDQYSPPSSLMSTSIKGGSVLESSWQSHYPIPETTRTLHTSHSFLYHHLFYPKCLRFIDHLSQVGSNEISSAQKRIFVFSPLCFFPSILFNYILYKLCFRYFFLLLVFLIWTVSSKREMNFVYFVFFSVPNTLTNAF